MCNGVARRKDETLIVAMPVHTADADLDGLSLHAALQITFDGFSKTILIPGLATAPNQNHTQSLMRRLVHDGCRP